MTKSKTKGDSPISLSEFQEQERERYVFEILEHDDDVFEIISSNEQQQQHRIQRVQTAYRVVEPANYNNSAVSAKQTPTLVLLHGISIGGIALFNDIQQELKEKGFRSVTYDQFGRGLSSRHVAMRKKASPSSSSSTWPRNDDVFELLQKQLAEVLEQLQLGDGDYYLLGSSMGAALAVRANADALCIPRKTCYVVPLTEPLSDVFLQNTFPHHAIRAVARPCFEYILFPLLTFVFEFDSIVTNQFKNAVVDMCKQLFINRNKEATNEINANILKKEEQRKNNPSFSSRNHFAMSANIKGTIEFILRFMIKKELRTRNFLEDHKKVASSSPASVSTTKEGRKDETKKKQNTWVQFIYGLDDPEMDPLSVERAIGVYDKETVTVVPIENGKHYLTHAPHSHKKQMIDAIVDFFSES